MQRDYRAKYLLAEELAVAKIAKDLGLSVRRGVQVRGSSGTRFDGAAESEKHDYIIEVVYIRRGLHSTKMWRYKMAQLTKFYERLPDTRKQRFRVILALVYDKDEASHRDRELKKVRKLTSEMKYAVDVKHYCYDELADEFNLK